jgi:uncharacterized protein YwgA
MQTELRASPIKPPTYHRQRLLLFLLEQAGGTLSKLDLQKLLFLYVEESGTKHYAFVPYRFGCYSFLAADDLDLLHKRDWLTLLDKEISLKRSLRGQVWAVNSEERQTVWRWMVKNNKRGSELIRHVYRRYPWYAIQSEIKENILNPKELERVHLAKAIEVQPDKTSGLKRVIDMLDQKKRVALTCFEKEPHCCHRHCVSDLLAGQYGLTVVHL